MYNKVQKSDVDALIGFTEKDRVFYGDMISEDYGHDEMSQFHAMPEVLVKVLSQDEIVAIMAYANERRIPVVVRGSGTGLVGSAVATMGGIMLEMTGMNKILELDTENLTVTVEPGVLHMQLTEFVQNEGFMYPPDPGEKSATIAGNISTNAGGMRAVKYGVTRDYVMGLTVVLPDGEVIELGGKTVKNSSGYSLLHLMIGSEGTLGVITKATMKLVAMPTVSVSLLVPFLDIDTALETVPKIIKNKSMPTAMEYFGREPILVAEDYLGKKFPSNEFDSYLLLTFDGTSREAVEQEYKAVADFCLENGAADVYIVDTDERKSAVWSTRSAFLEAIKSATTQVDECDVVVPRSRVADFFKYCQGLSQQFNMRIITYGHAGDGNLHITMMRDQLSEQQWQQSLRESFDLMYNRAEEWGGLVSGEHGIGFAKAEYLVRSQGEKQIELMRKIKQVFDPNMILNPQKIFK